MCVRSWAKYSGHHKLGLRKLRAKTRMENWGLNDPKPLITSVGHGNIKNLHARQGLPRELARRGVKRPLHRRIHHLEHAASRRTHKNQRIPERRQHRVGHFLPHPVRRPLVNRFRRREARQSQEQKTKEKKGIRCMGRWKRHISSNIPRAPSQASGITTISHAASGSSTRGRHIF